MSDYSGIAIFAFIMVLWCATKISTLEKKVNNLEVRVTALEIKFDHVWDKVNK